MDSPTGSPDSEAGVPAQFSRVAPVGEPPAAAPADSAAARPTSSEPTGPVPSNPANRGRLIVAGVVGAIVLVAVLVAVVLGVRSPSTAQPAPAQPASGTRAAAPAAPAGSGSAAPAQPAGTTIRSSTSQSPAQFTTPANPVPYAGAAPCVAPQGTDAAGVPQTYEPAKAFDGQLTTAWRCPGDAVGQSITFSFGIPVRLTSVGLVPGFDKVDANDGADRFLQGRKVQRVRWTFDDGTTVEASPNGVRGMYTTAVDTVTQSATLTILATTTGSTITNQQGESLAAVDVTAVSEVSFAGFTGPYPSE